MKAWKAYEYDSPTNYMTVVFAETASKARSVAMGTEALEDVPYTDIRVNRLKEMDDHYRGKDEVDWYNDEDRKALVHIGWSCEEPSWLCDTCIAKDECRWQEEC